jgi:uncharacterized protein YcbX
MSDSGQASVKALYRYPVKGLTPESLARVALAPLATLPFDRAYAIENGPGPFDPANPTHLPKIHFVMLMKNDELATLRSEFDDATHVLKLSRNGSVLAMGDLRTEAGRTAVEDVIAGTITQGLRGRPRIVASPGHSFSDVAAKCVHVINLASVRALEALLGKTIDPRRFRPNFVIDGLAPWSELEMVGRRLTIGGVVLEIFKRTERCAATNVDPETGARDLKIPSFLSRTLGHTDFGVYVRVISGGELALGDTLALSS